MSDLPIDPELSYVSKATFLHLWDKFKQQEKDLAQAQDINTNLAKNVLRLGSECRDWFGQTDALKQELARVMEDLHTANDALASLRLDHKWLISCHKTIRSTYHQHILAIAVAGQGIADAGEYNPEDEKWVAYDKAMAEALDAFKQ